MSTPPTIHQLDLYSTLSWTHL